MRAAFSENDGDDGGDANGDEDGNENGPPPSIEPRRPRADGFSGGSRGM